MPDTVASRNWSIIGGDIKCAYWLPTHKQRPSKKGGSKKITWSAIQNYYTKFPSSNNPAVEHKSSMAGDYSLECGQVSTI
jgi:hypothetical protein